MRLKLAAIILLIIVGAVCVALHLRLDAQLRDMATREGFTPFYIRFDNDMPLYWINRPHHLLRIISFDDSDLGATILTVAATLFFAFLGWMLRGSFMPFVIVPLAIGFNILATGAFFARVQFPVDFSLDQDRGMFLSEAVPIAAACDARKVTVENRTGAHGGPHYWLVATLKSGGSADLEVFATDTAAQAVAREVSTALGRLPCNAG